MLDRFLGGRIAVEQPRGGFRAGLDAVMLAAAVPARAGEQVLELGTGNGVAALCLARRVPGVRVTGVEIEPGLAARANANAARNGFAEEVEVFAADVFALPRSLRRGFAHVMLNPPFHDAKTGRSGAKSGATHGDVGRWLAVAMKRVAARGTLTAILRADRLAEALAALPTGGVTILPLWPRADEPAGRIIVRVRAGARAPLVLHPGLVLHRADGAYTREADAVLRDGAALATAIPAR